MTLKIKPATKKALYAHSRLCEQACQQCEIDYNNRPIVQFIKNYSFPLFIVQPLSAFFVLAYRGASDFWATAYICATALFQMSMCIPSTLFKKVRFQKETLERHYKEAIENNQSLLEHRQICQMALKNYMNAKTPSAKKVHANTIRTVFKSHQELKDKAIAHEEQHLPLKHRSIQICRLAGRKTLERAS